MLVDSNILIYAAQLRHAQVRRLIADHAPAVSAVSYVEVLGYHQLDERNGSIWKHFSPDAGFAPLASCPGSGRSTAPTTENR